MYMVYSPRKRSLLQCGYIMIGSSAAADMWHSPPLYRKEELIDATPNEKKNNLSLSF